MNGIHDGEKSKNVRFNGGHVELASRDHYLFKIRPRIMGQEFDSGKVSLTSNSHHIRHWIVRYSVIFIYFLVFLSLAYIFRGIFL